MPLLYSMVVLSLFLLVYIIGLIGNGLLIFIVFRQKNLRTVPNLLVVSLALGDFLFVLFCVPFGAVAYSFDNYPFPTFYCRFENFIINLSLGVSVFSLLALSADRYKIIVKPFSSHANDPSIKLKTVVIAIWLLSILLALPETIYSGLVKDTFNQPNNRTTQLTFCWSPSQAELLSNRPFMISRQIIRLIIYYIMPLVFVSIFYVLIAKHLFQTKSVILTPVSTQPFLNEVTLIRRGQMNVRSSKTPPVSHILLRNSVIREPPCLKEITGNNYKQNHLVCSLPFDNEDSMRATESSPTLLPAASSPPSIHQLRRSRDLLCGNSIMNNNNLAIHTLYQDVKTGKQLRARHKVAKTVLFLCIVFFICWLPKQIHDLYWFIGVILYHSSWNHFWQFNKTAALILSYVYSCVNPFALYFLSSTFRYFYKHYLFFWTKKSCCGFNRRSSSYSQRRRTGEMTTLSEYPYRSSANNVTNMFYESNRMRTSNLCQKQQQSPTIRIHRHTTPDRASIDSVPQPNGNVAQSTLVKNNC